LSGGVGVASWTEFGQELSSETFTGFGLTGGVGYEFADRWLLDIAVTYGQPGESAGGAEGRDLNMFQAWVGISWLSH
jgi:opacity protein-like surface antigen